MTPAQQGTGTSRRHIALLGGIKIREIAPADLLAISLIGGADVDLTRTTPPPVFTLTKISIVGGTHVRVPRDAVVQVDGFSLVGRFREVPPAQPGDTEPPVVRIRAYGFWGGVRVDRA